MGLYLPNSENLPSVDRSFWMVDPGVLFLNHGSFGSCPRPVLEYQRQLRDRLEQQPVRFLVRELEGLLDQAREGLAHFVGAQAENLVFVQNATSGVNTVLRSLRFQPGDELLVTDHEYNACRCALEYVAQTSGAKVVVAHVPFPFQNTGEILESILACVTPRTRIALIDHVTSQTAVIMPIAQIVQELAARGVDTLVDGAHAPGMVPLDLESLGAAYYTGNCHKWLCTPKTSALLYVRPDRQSLIHPLCISHGYTSPRTDRSRFLIEFAWMGTSDPTPQLCVAESIRVVASLVPGGWNEVMQRNRDLALAARTLLCKTLAIDTPCPDEFIGSMASLPLPDRTNEEHAVAPLFLDPLQERLYQQHGIEVPIVPWPAPPERLVRISAQLYNSLDQYEQLAAALQTQLKG